MNNYKAHVIKLEKDNFKVLEQFDNLVLYFHNSLPVLVNKTVMNNNEQLFLFFEPNTQISHWFLSEHSLYKIDPVTNIKQNGFFERNRRVKTLKLKGVFSLGFIYQLTEEEVINNNLSDGMIIDKLNDKDLCKRYYTDEELQVIKSLQKNAKASKFSHKFVQHCDTMFIQNAIQLITPGDKIVITNKLHGTSQRSGRYIVNDIPKNGLQRFYFPKYTLQTGTRRVNKFIDNTVYGNSSYYLDADTKDRFIIHKYLMTLPLYNNEQLFYEVVGYWSNGAKIMPNVDKKAFTYCNDVGNCSIYIYNITQNGISLPYNKFVERCKQLGLTPCTYITELIYENKQQLFSIVDELHNKYFHNDITGGNGHPNEGVVLRIEKNNGCVLFVKAKTHWFYHGEESSNVLDV